MSILNYTTQIAAEKTVAEIQGMLGRAKCCAVMSEYSEGIISAISFRIQTPCGLMSFRLPCDVQKIYQVLARSKIASGLKTKEQAARVSWRILKDWLAAQLALISAEMADLHQVFLPYAQDNQGVTLFERLRDGGFDGLALGNGKPTPEAAR